MNKDLEKIRKRLHHGVVQRRPPEYLDTRVPDLNAVLGNRELGLRYGNVIEVSAWESQGKTALALLIAALGQADGAHICWDDFENSFDPVWSNKRGLQVEVDGDGEATGPDSFTLIQPYVGDFGAADDEGKKVRAELATAQILCVETEEVLRLKAKKYKKQILVVDSVAAMLTAGEAAAGIEEQNMRTNMDLPMFMSRLMRRWMGLAQTHNVMIFLVNQLRSRPDKYRPEYSPAGNAIRFYCHIRAGMRRAKGGVIRNHGEVVGIQGVITNVKNKSGSPERRDIGFKLPFDGPFEFVSAKKLKKQEQGEDL